MARAFYAEALNEAGIATLEIDYLTGRGIPATPRHNCRMRMTPTDALGIMGPGEEHQCDELRRLNRQYTGGSSPRLIWDSTDLLDPSSGGPDIPVSSPPSTSV